MSKKPENNYSVDMPFARLFKHSKVTVAERKLASHNVYPEIILIAAIALSANAWNSGILTLVIWCVVLFLLITLSLTNTRTRLLPNALTRPLAVIAAAYAIALSIHFGNSWLVVSAAIGALLVAGVPYVLFQVSAGKWIGGGDVKLGLAAGLLLGWRYSLLCVGLMIVLSLLSFFIESVSGKLAKNGRVTHIGTGTLWAIAITVCILVSQ
jgi:prepilin signal peptidase PulO-like enzyme (type II secretory pathway)